MSHLNLDVSLSQIEKDILELAESTKTYSIFFQGGMTSKWVH